jgi:hypothetical protein
MTVSFALSACASITFMRCKSSMQQKDQATSALFKDTNNKAMHSFDELYYLQ